jgi:hypothetical protein
VPHWDVFDYIAAILIRKCGEDLEGALLQDSSGALDDGPRFEQPGGSVSGSLLLVKAQCHSCPVAVSSFSGSLSKSFQALVND